jgi:DNA-binding MurR/RpiR family transcriptional regulator
LQYAVGVLAARRARVVVLPGGASVGVGRQLCDELALLRPDVTLVSGSPLAIAARTTDLGEGDVVVAIDLRRYDRSVLDAVALARDSNTTVVAITDTLLSPLAGYADATLVVAVEGAGPFDSHLGVLAVANALVAGVAGRLRRTATARIDRVEDAWRSTGAVVDM